MSPECREHFPRKRPIELRVIDRGDIFRGEKRPPDQAVWVRATRVLPPDVALQQCVLAYASDMTLLDTSLLPHGTNWFDKRILLASLDRAIWFHHAFRADEWPLYAQNSPSTSGARGFSRRLIYSRDGKLLASVAQECTFHVQRPVNTCTATHEALTRR
jgi:acyl-CoA thioesterase-2